MNTIKKFLSYAFDSFWSEISKPGFNYCSLIFFVSIIIPDFVRKEWRNLLTKVTTSSRSSATSKRFPIFLLFFFSDSQLDW
jgi:hypothetical protein